MLPLFHFLHDRGELNPDEMLRVFNMGIGMALIVGAETVDRVVRRLGTSRQPFFFIGNVRKGKGEVVYDRPPAGFPSWL